MAHDKLSWGLDLITEDIQGVNIIPTLLIQKHLPYKLIFSVKRRVYVIINPSLHILSETFKNSLTKISQTVFACCTMKSGKTESISESEFYLQIQFSRFKIIQSSRQSNFLTIFHKIEFKTDHYNSWMHIKRKHKDIPYDDIVTEKIAMKFAVELIKLVEKGQEYVDEIKVSLFKNEVGEVVFEGIKDCVTSRSFKDRSINKLQLVMFSTQIKLQTSVFHRDVALNKSYSGHMKPKLKISKDKIAVGISLFPDIKARNIKTGVFGCNLGYCGVKIEVKTINKRRKVPFWRYAVVNHSLVFQILQQIDFPITEKQFEHEFGVKYEEANIKLSENIAKNTRSNSSLISTNEQLTLCPVCYKIFSISYMKHNTQSTLNH